MSLRARIVLLMSVIAAAVFAMAAMVYLTLRNTDDDRERVAFAHRQLAAMTALANSANRYSGQISEVLLLGESEMPDFDAARAALEAKQAVVILVDNALKYTQSADVVRVTAGRNGAFAEVAVIDRGPGIAGEDLPYVFDRFYRGRARRRSRR